MSRPDLILASSSRYRRELLARLGLPFEAVSPDLEEARRDGEAPADMASRLAAAKARAVAVGQPAAVVIGSDQVAELGGEVLGKPGDEAAAVAQLLACSGCTVRFLTALCVVAPDGTALQHLDETRVVFRELDEDAVRAYVAAEQPLDCAGAFKVEGLGITLFDAVETVDPTALIGLPLIATARCLRELGLLG